MVPQTPQLRRQLCVIHFTVFGPVQLFLATSSAQRVFMSKHAWVCPAGPPWPIRDAGVRPVAFSHASSSRVRIGLIPISAFILRADAFIAASFCARPSSWASATHVPANRTNRPQTLRAHEAGCMTAAGLAALATQPNVHQVRSTAALRCQWSSRPRTSSTLHCQWHSLGLDPGQPSRIDTRSTVYSLVPPPTESTRGGYHAAVPVREPSMRQ